MNIFYDTCALLSELKDVFNDKDKIYISNITLNELENIKTSAYKDEEIKYSARKLLHLFENNEDKYEIVFISKETDKIIKKNNLPDTNDSKIIANSSISGQ